MTLRIVEARASGSPLALFALLLNCLPAVPTQSATSPALAVLAARSTYSQNQQSLSQNRAIPLPQIAERAEELDRLLYEIDSHLTAGAVSFGDGIDARETEEIRRRMFQTKELLAGTPTPRDVEEERWYWRFREQDYTSRRRALTGRATELQEQLNFLSAQEPDWQFTLDQIRLNTGIEPILRRVQAQLATIRDTRDRVQQQLNIALTLQNQISQQEVQISNLLRQLLEFRERERERLFEQDSPPLWSRRLSEPANMERSTWAQFSDRLFASSREFLRAHRRTTLVLLVLYFLAFAAMLKLRKYVESGNTLQISADARQALDHPWAIALLFALIGTGEFIAAAPMAIAFSFYLLYLVPVVRLLIPVSQPQARKFLYLLSTFYALEGLYLLAQLPPTPRRQVHLVLVLGALISFAWLGNFSWLKDAAKTSLTMRSVLIGVRIAAVLLLVSLLANVAGFFLLAQVLALNVLVGSFLAAALYCAVRIFRLVLTTALQTESVRRLLGAGYAKVMERWGGRAVIFAGALLWLRAVLQVLTLYDIFIGFAAKVLQAPIGFDRFHFTLAGTLTIVCILLGGYVLAKIIVFFLRDTLLPRIPVKRGVSYAISTVSYYILLVLVALAALSAAGVELNKFTVLTGALGVGLGFGLQNIVNNFVSGVILLFERPIHIGDTVDVGGLVGIVRRIGARSSTVVTFQGAEVIVPNSNLLSNQVINWTLSSQLRRVDVPIGVALGTDPEMVIRILVNVAENHPGVLLERPPEAFFLGFSESSLRFELRFWSASQDTWFQLQSDVTIAVAKALKDSNIEIPFPQRDLRLRTVDPTVAELWHPATPEASQPPQLRSKASASGDKM